jgi:hypothetical protein
MHPLYPQRPRAKGRVTVRAGAAIRLRIATAVAALAVIAIAIPARAAVVSGIFTYDNGSPAKRRQLHFENRATGDMFIAQTDPGGAFSVDLPPGLYDLRAERGVVLKANVEVGESDVSVGKVVEPAPLDVRRPFEHEGVAEALVEGPAPSTANLQSGRPLAGMKYGHEALSAYGRPVQNLPGMAATASGGTADTKAPQPLPQPSPAPLP